MRELRKDTLLQTLKNYDKDNIPDKGIADVRKDFLHYEGLTPSEISTSSSAAAGLCMWVLAMVAYHHHAAQIVAQKNVSLQQAQEQLVAAKEVSKKFERQSSSNFDARAKAAPLFHTKFPVAPSDLNSDVVARPDSSKSSVPAVARGRAPPVSSIVGPAAGGGQAACVMPSFGSGNGERYLS